MPMSQWPCKPESLLEIMDDNKDLINYILAGAAEQYHLPIMLMDKKNRYDPFNPRQQSSSFCSFLRGEPNNENCAGLPGADKKCEEWDAEKANEVLSDQTLPYHEPIPKPCWLGLYDYPVIIEVANHRFVMITGQFISNEKTNKHIENIQLNVLEKLYLENDEISASSDEIDSLLQLVSDQPKATSEILQKISDCSKDIKKQFEIHWQLRRDALEELIYKDIIKHTHSILISPSTGGSVDWDKVNQLLEVLGKHLGCQKILIFTHDSYRGQLLDTKQNVLRLKASYGLTSELIKHCPHFNWTKSKIESYSEECILTPDANQITINGLKEGTIINSNEIDIWYTHKDDMNNCRTVIALGEFDNFPMAKERKEFLKNVLSVIIQKIDALQLYTETYNSKEFNFELADFLVHQVRSKLQSLYGFQYTAKQFSLGNKTKEEFAIANTRLGKAISDLAIIANDVHANNPKLYDPQSLVLEQITPSYVIDAAIEDQSAYAELRKITFKKKIDELPLISADPFWLRILLGNLINNAIKYSRTAKDGEIRYIDIVCENSYQEVNIYITNIGLGILDKEKNKIFLPGERAEITGKFENRSGFRRGLHEAKKIAFAHNESYIEVNSTHRSGVSVTESNIENCITTFILHLKQNN